MTSKPMGFGTVLTVSGLPASDTRRWSARRKGEIVAAVEGGLLSAEEACSIYELSMDEFLSWKSAVALHGLAGLRARHPRQTERGQAQHERRSFSALNVGRWGSRMEPEQSMTSATNETERTNRDWRDRTNAKAPARLCRKRARLGRTGAGSVRRSHIHVAQEDVAAMSRGRSSVPSTTQQSDETARF
jgi:hypothetical protein